MLADHPDILARLRKEVLDTIGPTGKVSPENLKEMKYLRAVLNGKPFLAPRRPSILNFCRDPEVVSECVRTSIPPSFMIRLNAVSQSMERQVFQERRRLASS